MTDLRLPAIVLLALATGCQPAPEKVTDTTGAARDATRPTFELATDDAYDLGTIAPYAGAHTAVYDHIDANLDGHLAAIQRWLRQPSISAQDVGIDAMAAMLRDDLLALGFAEAELVPTDGHPGVWGFYERRRRARHRPPR